MKNLPFIIAGFLIFCGFCNCKKGEENNNPGKEKQEYKGTANVIIRYYDYNPYTGQDEFIEEKHYSNNVFVFINPQRLQEEFPNQIRLVCKLIPTGLFNKMKRGMLTSVHVLY